MIEWRHQYINITSSDSTLCLANKKKYTFGLKCWSYRLPQTNPHAKACNWQVYYSNLKHQLRHTSLWWTIGRMASYLERVIPSRAIWIAFFVFTQLPRHQVTQVKGSCMIVMAFLPSHLLRTCWETITVRSTIEFQQIEEVGMSNCQQQTRHLHSGH